MPSLAEINRLDEAAFVALLGGVFEHSPWVAARAHAARPFASRAALHAAMHRAVRDAGRDAQLALVRAHPELSGREAIEGRLSPGSRGEQGRLGIDRLPHDEFARMRALNDAWRAKFGFPCIIALRLHADRASVFAEFERRLAGDAEAELEHALAQIDAIADGRLAQLVTE